MALEDLTGDGKFISDLNNANPTGTDNKSQGDDHLRGIKNVLLNTFPNLSGVVSVTQTQLNNILPSGTKLLFYQASVPTGWTQDTTKNDYMLRAVSGVGGGSGGSDSAILNDKVPIHNHTASSNVTGEHTHTLTVFTSRVFNTISARSDFNDNPVEQETSADGDHSHVITVDNNAGSNWVPKYLNMAIGVKD